MSLRITWKKGPVYPSFVKGLAAGVVDGRLLAVGGMSWPWREREDGFWLATWFMGQQHNFSLRNKVV